MKILKRKDDLRGIKFGKAYIKLLTLLDQLIKLSTINIFHYQVQRASILLNTLQVRYEGMIQLLLQCHLIKDVIYLFCFDNGTLRENFYGT